MNKAVAPSFQLLSPADIESLPDLEWLIGGILPAASLGVLYGEPGCGKTFVALSMALTIASGEPWLERTTKQTKVLYIAAEGVLGLKYRIRAHSHRLGINPDNIRFIAKPFTITDVKAVKALLDYLKDEGFMPGLIVIDTLARVALGTDENNAKDMGLVVDGLDKLKRQTDATVLVIHHTRKDGHSERGSSALRGAADVMIACEKSETLSALGARLKCAKMKDDEPFKDIGATLEKVEMPDGKSSLIVRGTFDLLAAASAHADKIIEILENQFADKGATNGALMKAFIASSGASKSTFDRAWRDLKKTDRVRIEKTSEKALIFPASVSVSPVSGECQTTADVSVKSPPSLGGDTDT